MSDLIQSIKEAVQTPYHQDLQAVLWSAVGLWFWRGMSLAASINSLFLFKSILGDMHHRRALGVPRWDAIMVGRLGWLGGVILAIFIPINSGYQPWSLAMLVTAGAFMAFLIDSKWCSRRGSFWEKMRAIAKAYREAFRDRPAAKDVAHIGHD